MSGDQDQEVGGYCVQGRFQLKIKRERCTNHCHGRWDQQGCPGSRAGSICTCVTGRCATAYMSDSFLGRSLDAAVDGLGLASCHSDASAQPLQGLSFRQEGEKCSQGRRGLAWE